LIDNKYIINGQIEKNTN